MIFCQFSLNSIMKLDRRPEGLLFQIWSWSVLNIRRSYVCKQDLKLTDINLESWEKLADNRDGWCHAVRDGVRSGEEKRNLQLENKQTQRKERQQTADSNQPSNFACNNCGRDCHARIGLLSDIRRCSQQKD